MLSFPVIAGLVVGPALAFTTTAFTYKVSTDSFFGRWGDLSYSLPAIRPGRL